MKWLTFYKWSFPLVLALGLLTLLPTAQAAGEDHDNNGLSIAASRVPVRLFTHRPVFHPPGEYGIAAVVGDLDTRGLAQGAKVLQIELPDGRIVDLNNDDIERRGPADVAWRGHVAGDEDSEAILTLKKGLVFGRLRIDNETYEVSSRLGGRMTVKQLDLSSLPACDTGEQHVRYGARDAKADDLSQGGLEAAAAAGDTGVVIDLLVVYSNDALSDQGSVAAMEALIQAAVDNANASFANSNMTASYRLVHTAPVNYNTAGSTGDDLGWVTNNAEVAALRNQYGADMVHILVDTPSSCGTAWVQRSPGPGFEDNAFAATDVDCAVGNLTFAHEHGHNIGMEHNPLNSSASSSTASYPWSFGHYVDGSFRTVMSYSAQCTNGCSRATKFSNPNITHNSYLAGIEDNRDNARTGELTGPITADFRATVVPNSSNTVFAAIGDYADGSTAEGNVATLVNGWGADFVITMGDNRYGSSSFDTVVGQFYCDYLTDVISGSYCAGNSPSNAFFPAPGNHDYTDGSGINEYMNYFVLPGTGVTSSGSSGSERYYDYVQGAVHFFVLDSQGALTNSSEMTAQQNWLQQQLAASTAVWKIVYLHHAPYSSSSSHGSNTAMQWPFAAWGADAVIAGHDHTYERLSANGISYFVNGLGGRSLYSFGTPLVNSQFRYNGDYGAMRISADTTHMTFEFINTSGSLIDSHTIQNDGVVTASIASSSDDVEERASDGVLDMTSTDIELGDDPGHNEDQTVGLRFSGLNIPQGATILSASLEFTVDETDIGELTDVMVYAQAADDAPAFAATINNVTSRPLTSASLSWNIATWDTVGTAQLSPDLSPLVQEVVDRTGWSSNNSMVFVISGTGSRTAESFDGSAGSAPLLRIEYDLTPPASGTADVRVAVANDDVEQKLSDGAMYFNSTDLELGDDPGFNGVQTVGLRFQGLNIPQGATIDVAYLEFTVDENASQTTTNVLIEAEAIDSAPPFDSSAYNVTDRSLTSSSVAWNIPVWNTIGTTQQSPDISAVVQEVVDLAGWSAGNNMVLVVSGTGERTAEAFDGVPAAAPRLYVEYSSAPTSNSNPVAGFDNACVVLDCSFTDTSTDSDGNIASWLWNFGDAATSSDQNPSHSYATAGTYIVGLTVTDNDGATDSTNTSVTVTASNSAPTASFTSSTTDLTSNFTDTSSDSDGTIVSRSWTFGDGGTSSAQNPSHNYASAGTYTVGLTVTDNDGATDSTSTSVTVIDPVVQPPNAPSNLTADIVKTGKGKNKTISSVTLNWLDNSNNENSFEVERCLEIISGKGKKRTVTCDYLPYDSVVAGVDTLQVGTEEDYRYRVRAYNAAGFSAYSNDVKI